MQKVLEEISDTASQMFNYILDSGANCHMTQDISYFISGSLVERDKYIEVADMNLFTTKQTGEV